MALSEADEIMGLEPDGVSAFISERCRAKTFSQLVRDLNAALMGDDPEDHVMAQAALARLGLLEVA